MAVASEQEYLQGLLGLLPHGPAWPRDEDTPTARLYAGLAPELVRIDARMHQLLDEADPRTAYELLPDWERVAKLPDGCALLAGIDLTIEQRQAALTAKLTARGGQSSPYFIELAARLGFTVTVTEFREHSVGDTVDAAINGAAWAYAWQINAPASTVLEMTVTSDVDTPFGVWGNQMLECAIGKDKPAHSYVLFSYA